jgi:hypothetical protein
MAVDAGAFKNVPAEFGVPDSQSVVVDEVGALIESFDDEICENLDSEIRKARAWERMRGIKNAILHHLGVRGSQVVKAGVDHTSDLLSIV